MNFKTHYRIVLNDYGYDAQYRKWWNPFWSPCLDGDQFTRSQFTFADAQKVCDAHYKVCDAHYNESLKPYSVCYYNPSDSSVTFK